MGRPRTQTRTGGLGLGCVQRVFDPDVNQATVAVLSANGFEVVILSNRAAVELSPITKENSSTKTLARDLIQAFKTSEPVDAVLIAASGCGHTLKQYGQILAGEAQTSFEAPVKDVHEFLSEVGLAPSFAEQLTPLAHADGSPSSAERPLAVAFHDACHMIHGQGIKAQPRQLLKAIPHLALKEALDAGVCCGSAGIYNLVQPEAAAEWVG